MEQSVLTPTSPPLDVNKVNLYEAQDQFEQVMNMMKKELNVDDGVMCDLALSYVRNLVVYNVADKSKTR